MPVFLIISLVMAILASVLFWSLGKTRIVDRVIRRLWLTLSLSLSGIVAVQCIYLSVFSSATAGVVFFSMIILAVLFCAAGLMIKTLDYIESVNTINGIEIIDETTEVYNQTYLEQRLSNEVARCHRYGSPLSVVSLSVVGFSTLQEEFGHQAGGIALKKIASKLVALLRETDVVTCIGNGRFVLILPDTPESSVDGLVTRLHGAVDGMEVINGAEKEKSVLINVKFGKSHCSLQTDKSRELIDRAIAREAAINEGLRMAA